MFNKVILIGHVGQDGITRELSQGNYVINFNLATSRSYKKQGEWVNETEWHRCVYYTKYTETKVLKGNMVVATGRIASREYEDNNGVTKKITEIIVDSLRTIRKNNTEESRKPSRSYEPQSNDDDDYFDDDF